MPANSYLLTELVYVNVPGQSGEKGLPETEGRGRTGPVHSGGASRSLKVECLINGFDKCDSKS